jgi:serine/threonine protein kinase/Tol biopolymer transport system component
MSLTTGTRLGRYEIRSKIGEGGMGEVYLAFDTELDRTVAIKTLAEAVASNQQRMQRFVQEAKAASALNHPNILTIHEIGTQPDNHFIVTEFIDGETLRQHMVHTRLTLSGAVDIALQVASALASAHAAGIVHRDVKPENIMLRRDGIVKVLDFGLAKLTERWRAAEVDHDAATKAMVQTEPGVVMGTTAYMSPEQARGLEVDTRTDVWSLGVVLYEMISGQEPFKSETASDTSAAILKSEPRALSQLVPDLPAELERIVRKALQKDREERYQGIKDLQLDLKSLKRDLEVSTPIERSSGAYSQERRSTRAPATPTAAIGDPATQASGPTQLLGLTTSARWLWLGTILMIGLLVGSGWYWWRQPKGAEANRFGALTVTKLVSRKNDLGESGASHARFSPDGKFVTYAASRGANTSIWLKQIGSGEPFTSQSEQGQATSPIWAPDGLQIAFLSKRDTQIGIWTMPAFGGSPSLLKGLESFSRELVGWSRDGTIYFEVQGNLYALEVASQRISQVTQFDTSQPGDRSFSVAPDEKRIAYTDNKDGQRDIWIVPSSGGEPQRITNDKAEDSNPVWTPDGHIIYSSKRNGLKQICLVRLDGRPPTQLTANDSNSEVVDVSPDGTKILYATARDESDLWSVKLDAAKELQLTADIGIEMWADIAPDGNTIAFQGTPAATGATMLNCPLLSKPLDRDVQAAELTPDGYAPRWSPDGKRIAFLRYSSGRSNLWVVNAAGGDARPVTTGGVMFGGFSFLPYNRLQTQDFQWADDGNRLIYCATDSGVANVWQIGVDGSGATKLSNNTDANVHFFNPVLSPDGQSVAWLAMSSAGRGLKQTSWSIWLAKDGKGQQLFQSGSVLGLVGWTQSGHELIAKSISDKLPPKTPVDVSLMVLAVAGGTPRSLAELKATYFANIQMAAARNQIAYVTRRDGADSLQVVPAAGGAPKTIITSNDSRVYFAGLVWSPDGKTLYFARQASWSVLSMIDNFK